MDPETRALCPDLRQIVDFYLGKLDEDFIEGIFVHLEVCGACEKLLEQIEKKHSVPFLEKLKSMSLTDDRAFLQEDEYQQAVRNLPTVIEQVEFPDKEV